MFEPKTILTLGLVDGNVSSKEPFCIDGTWEYWGKMSPLSKSKVLNRKVTIAGASKKDDEEQFWQSIASINNIHVRE